jgi:hypothetical protein
MDPDPDPGGPKTYGSESGFGSSTLGQTLNFLSIICCLLYFLGILFNGHRPIKHELQRKINVSFASMKEK